MRSNGAGLSKAGDGWHVALAAAGLGLAACVMFGDSIFGSQLLFCRDLADLHYPVLRHIGQELRHGSLPLWFPYEGLGIPLVGKAVAGVFYPLTWLHAVLATATAIKLEVVLSFAVAGGSTWALAREVGCARWAAWLAAIAYTLGGAFVGLVMNLTYLRGAVAFVLFVLGLQRLLSRGRGGWLTAAAGVALSILAGDLQTTFAIALVGVAWVIALAFAEASTRELWANVRRVAGAGLLGACVAAVQLLPTLRAFLTTDRGEGLSFAEASTWSLHPLRLLDLFLGDGVRWQPGGPLNEVRAHLLHVDSFWSPTVFLGTVTLVGLVLALVVGPVRERRFDRAVAAMGAGLLLGALGPATPAFELAYKLVPLWSSFRFPEKWVLHASLLLAICAARGWTRFSHAEAPEQRRTAAPVLAGLALLVGALVLGGLLAGASPAGTYLRQLSGSAAIGLGVCGLLAALVAGTGARIRPALRWTLGPLALGAHLFVVNGPVADYCSAPAELALGPNEVAQALQRRAGPALGRYRVNPAFNESGHISVAQGADLHVGSAAAISLWEKLVLYPDACAESGIEVPARLLPGRPPELAALMARGDALSLLPLFGTRFVTAAPDEISKLQTWRVDKVEALQGLGLAIGELADARPRAYLARPRWVSDLAGGMAALHEPSVRDGSEVVLEGKGPSLDRPVAGTAIVSAYQPRRVALEVRTDAPAYLVLNDAYDSGWRATVDGAPARIERANLLVRAVAVPPGTHQVVFEYPVPTELWLGGALSALSLIAAAMLALQGRRRRSGVVPRPAERASAGA